MGVSELESLRARIESLERELIERTERANAAVAAAEDRVYWLDRWRVDLNRLMRHPAAGRVQALMRALRVGYRKAREVREELPRAVAEPEAREPATIDGTFRGADFSRSGAPDRLRSTEVTDL